MIFGIFLEWKRDELRENRCSRAIGLLGLCNDSLRCKGTYVIYKSHSLIFKNGNYAAATKTLNVDYVHQSAPHAPVLRVAEHTKCTCYVISYRSLVYICIDEKLTK